MARITTASVFFLCLMVVPSAEVDSCPAICDCTKDFVGRINVICAGIKEPLANIISVLPKDATFISITDSNLTVIEYGAFSTFTKLRYLILSRNELREIPDNAFNANLNSLRLEHNQISKINRNAFRYLSKLETLVLNDNQLSDMENLRNANVKTLSLSGNHIAALFYDDLMELPKLTHLDLSQNMIDVMTIKPKPTQTYARGIPDETHGNVDEARVDNLEMDSLVHIDLSGNNLETLPLPLIQAAINVRTLDLSDNYLGTIRGLPALDNLEILNLKMNKIKSVNKEIKALNSSRLNTLLVSGNEIEHIESHAFAALSALETLDLSNMLSLTEIQDDAFSGLTSLTKLDLSHNPRLKKLPKLHLRFLEILNVRNSGIETFNEDHFSALPSLMAADISGNPIDCDCGALWINRILNERHIQYRWASAWLDPDLTPTCGSPSNMNAFPIKDVQPDDLTCDPPTISAYTPNDVVLQVGDNFTFQAVMTKGLPTGSWIAPDGIIVQPGDVVTLKQGQLELQESVILDHFVLSELLLQDVDESFQGEYTLLAKNAANGSSMYFTVNLTTADLNEDQPNDSMSRPVYDPKAIVEKLIKDHLEISLLRNTLHTPSQPNGRNQEVASVDEVRDQYISTLSWFGIAMAVIAVLFMVVLFSFSLHRSRQKRASVGCGVPYMRLQVSDTDTMSYGAI